MFIPVLEICKTEKRYFMQSYAMKHAHQDSLIMGNNLLLNPWIAYIFLPHSLDKSFKGVSEKYS
jgi:hypothetical protein